MIATKIAEKHGFVLEKELAQQQHDQRPGADRQRGRVRVGQVFEEMRGALPEAPSVVERAEALAQVFLGHALRDDPAAEQHLPEARPLLLEERDQL